MLDIALLGTGGMMPLPGRFLTALLVRYNGKMVLIDCGEGTQVTMKMLGWGYKSIDIICLTHYHADHIAGLPGLLLTIGNSGREEPITVMGPVGLKRVLEGVRIMAPELPFALKILELSHKQETIQHIHEMSIHSIPGDHMMPCLAYSIEISRGRKFDPTKAESQGIPRNIWRQLQKEETVEWEGQVFIPDQVLGEQRTGLKVCYCTDSRPMQSMVRFIEEADVFICEGMYGEEEKKDKAREYKHMLFSEAAQLAKQGNVKELWLTHFSPSLTNPYEFLEGTKKIFPNTIIGEDRMVKQVLFK